MEAEVEELQANVKKKQRPPQRLTELEDLVGRFKDHTDRLEKLLRCIDNETIQPEELEDLKGEMDMFLVRMRACHACMRCGRACESGRMRCVGGMVV